MSESDFDKIFSLLTVMAYVYIKKKETSFHWFKIPYCKKWPKLWNF